MSKLLLFIGENVKFDQREIVKILSEMPEVINLRQGNFIGASVECEYTHGDQSTIVRLSSDGETVTAEGLGDDSLKFALEFQRRLTIPLRAIDMEYSFDLSLSDISTVDEFRKRMST